MNLENAYAAEECYEDREPVVRPAPALRAGAATTVDSIEVHWPGGAVEQVKLPEVDGLFTVVKGSGVGKLEMWEPVAAQQVKSAAVRTGTRGSKAH